MPHFMVEVLGEVLAAERNMRQRETEEILEPLRCELAELRGQITTVLALLGGRAVQSDNVLDLPRMPLKGRALAA